MTKELGIIWSPEGLGAMTVQEFGHVLHLFDSLSPELQPYVLLTDREEIGGIGAREAVNLFRNILDSDDIGYFIEIDRRGSKEAVFYCDEPKLFRQYITKFGFAEAHGTFSDISIIGEACNKCAVNLSAGYYNEHSPREMLKTSEIYNTVHKVTKMLKDNEQNPKVWLNNSPKDKGKAIDDLFGQYFKKIQEE